jgi:hypothetical protein
MLKKLNVTLSQENSVVIEKSRDGEFRVPAPDGYENGAYYTDDKTDAVGTAKKMYGALMIAKFRSVPEFSGGKYEKYRPGSAHANSFNPDKKGNHKMRTIIVRLKETSASKANLVDGALKILLETVHTGFKPGKGGTKESNVMMALEKYVKTLPERELRALVDSKVSSRV